MRAKSPEEMRIAREKLFSNPEIFCPDGRQYQRVEVRGKIKKTTDCPDCAMRAKDRKREIREVIRAIEKAKIDQERAIKNGAKFDMERQRARFEEKLRELRARPLVTVD